MRGFAEAMEIIPYTLAENAGLNPIAVVTELRNRHAKGEKNAGINVRKVWTYMYICGIGLSFYHKLWYTSVTNLDTLHEVSSSLLLYTGHHY